MHDLVVHERIYPGANGEKMPAISALDLAHTRESIRLYAEIYPDDATEPLETHSDRQSLLYNFFVALDTLMC